MRSQRNLSLDIKDDEDFWRFHDLKFRRRFQGSRRFLTKLKNKKLLLEKNFFFVIFRCFGNFKNFKESKYSC